MSITVEAYIRLYKKLLQLYPKPFRDTYAEEMTLLMEDQLYDAYHLGSTPNRLFLSEILNLIVTAIMQRITLSSQMDPERRQKLFKHFLFIAVLTVGFHTALITFFESRTINTPYGFLEGVLTTIILWNEYKKILKNQILAFIPAIFAGYMFAISTSNVPVELSYFGALLGMMGDARLVGILVAELVVIIAYTVIRTRPKLQSKSLVLSKKQRIAFCSFVVCILFWNYSSATITSTQKQRENEVKKAEINSYIFTQQENTSDNMQNGWFEVARFTSSANGFFINAPKTELEKVRIQYQNESQVRLDSNPLYNAEMTTASKEERAAFVRASEFPHLFDPTDGFWKDIQNSEFYAFDNYQSNIQRQATFGRSALYRVNLAVLASLRNARETGEKDREIQELAAAMKILRAKANSGAESAGWILNSQVQSYLAIASTLDPKLYLEDQLQTLRESLITEAEMGKYLSNQFSRDVFTVYSDYDLENSAYLGNARNIVPPFTYRKARASEMYYDYWKAGKTFAETPCKSIASDPYPTFGQEYPDYRGIRAFVSRLLTVDGVAKSTLKVAGWQNTLREDKEKTCEYLSKIQANLGT